MRILGTFSILFGAGLIVLSFWGISQEMRSGSLFNSIGTIIAFGIMIAGACTAWFAGSTISMKRIHDRSAASSGELLDLPDHLQEEDMKYALSFFTIFCGYVAFVVAALVILWSIYSLYSIVQIVHDATPDLMVILLVECAFLAGSVITLTYCIRKLFFR
jgi:hypothetical protein